MHRRDFLKSTTAGALFLASPFMSSLADTSKPTIKIGYLPITDHLTMIAHSLLEFKNFRLEPVKFSSWPELAEALRANAIQGAFALTPIGLTLKKKGAPIKAVLAGHRNGSVITVRNSSEFTKVEDLRGKNIAIPSRFSTHNLLIQKLLKDNGMDPNKDVRLIDMAPPEMVNAMSTSSIDAFVVAEPFGAQADLHDIGKVLIHSKDVWKDHVCCTLNLREEVINGRPDIAQELVNGFVQAANYIEANPKDAAKLSKRYLGQRKEVIEHVLMSNKDIVSYDNLLVSQYDIDSTQDLMVAFDVAKGRIEASNYLDSSFAKKSYEIFKGAHA